MAMGIREMVVVVLAVLVVLVVQMERTDAAGIDTRSTSVEFPGWKSGRLSTHEDSVDEFLDEPTRRILSTSTSYISYGALTGNRSPCPSAGRSYYNNCANSGAGSSYSRSCTQITRCARG